MKILKTICRGFIFSLFGFVLFSTTYLNAQQSRSGSTLFRSINCRVLDDNGAKLPVVAYKSMKNKDEVILISQQADHALIVNFKEQKAYKVTKPLLGTNAVNVPNERPDGSGNVGFVVRENVKGKKDLTEIIVYFKNESCFLCGPQAFAAIWE